MEKIETVNTEEQEVIIDSFYTKDNIMEPKRIENEPFNDYKYRMKKINKDLKFRLKNGIGYIPSK